MTTDLITLKLLKDLPKGGMLQTSPITPEQAITWAERYKAETVYYWPKTKSAFILTGPK